MPAPEGIKGNERRNGNAGSRQFGSFSSLIKTAIASPRRRRFNQACCLESARTGEGCPVKKPVEMGLAGLSCRAVVVAVAEPVPFGVVERVVAVEPSVAAERVVAAEPSVAAELI